MMGVIISLKRYWLGIENLDIKLVLRMKNQLDDPKFGFTNEPKSIDEYFEVEDGMILENEHFIANFNLFEEE